MKNEYKLSFFATLTMATGFTIGSGIITQTGIGIAMTGRSIFLAFPVAAILYLICFRPIIILSSVLPSTSASYVYTKTLLSPEAGGLYVYIFFLGRITIAIFGISFVQYLSSIVPIFGDPILSKITAIGVLSLFFIINLFGVKMASIIQNTMFFILLAGLVTFVFFGIGKISPNFFSTATLFTNGFKGFYSAVSLLFFAVGGSYIITDFAPGIKNSKTVIPKIIGFVTIGVCILYMLLGIVGSGIIPVEEAAGKPLTLAARSVFSSHEALFIFFVVGGCLGALVTTLNSSFVWYSHSLINACREGWLPASWAKLNKRGVPYRLMSIFYLFGFIPTLFGVDLTVLSKMAIGLTIMSAYLPMLSIINLPKIYPKEWADSKYAKQYPTWRIRIMVCISSIIMLTQVVALFASNPVASNIIIIVYIMSVSLYLILRYQMQKKKRLQAELNRELQVNIQQEIK
ncbi:putative amino acid transporter [Treponema primitia ZAS-2]|uniref:Putative amino acid transporter n=1 Tax=Treponema primitia (strain ATCC BAA-887 / DSM 12427 / ZAS-2) TaxID=545694 RepID=F5YPD9_TREPZ|nr:APC family permease [Treponema primitia]AEF85062.1 putative amino acid transporter [Treponema primitia ZAS-2]